ncbi:MAG: hypothetical protein JWQ75_3008 [Pseudarthrobacter sp.]|nr:hypothetical protein [Pseudarthrobacter sp.]
MSASHFPGNGLFFDPLAAPAAAPARMQASGPLLDSTRAAAGHVPRRQALPEADEKALRAASLRNVSLDLERLSRRRLQG